MGKRPKPRAGTIFCAILSSVDAVAAAAEVQRLTLRTTGQDLCFRRIITGKTGFESVS